MMARTSLRVSRAMVMALAMLGLGGCGIPLASEDTSAAYASCQSDEDCGADAVCIPLGDIHSCVAKAADLGNLLLEIRTSSNSSFRPNTSFFIDLTASGVTFEGTLERGQSVRFDPTLEPLASISGQIFLDYSYLSCSFGADGSIPANVQFVSVVSHLGLPVQTFEAVATFDQASSSYSFAADIPVGTYDVYIKPEPDAECEAIPAVFLPNRLVNTSVDLSIDLPLPVRFQGSIQAPVASSLDSWFVEIVEPKAGRLVSESVVLDAIDDGSAAFDLKFDWSDGSITPIVRLRPPEGVAAPTIHWDLSALALEGSTTDLHINLSDLNLTTQSVSLLLSDAAGLPVVGTVSLESVELSGSTTTNATYKTQLDTDAEGRAALELPPGTYRIIARPFSDAKATTEAVWTVTADDGCECDFELQVASTYLVSGNVTDAAGQPISEGTVTAAAQLPADLPYLTTVLELEPVLPREVFGSVEEGRFAVLADAGEFNLTIRTPEQWGLPWLVQRHIQVPVEGELDLALPNPAVMSGFIVDSNGAGVAGAVVNVWQVVKNDGSMREGEIEEMVIPIAQASTDEAGNYLLILASVRDKN